MFKQLHIILLISVFHFSIQQSGAHDDKLHTGLDSGHLLADSGHRIADTGELRRTIVDTQELRRTIADTGELRRTKRDRSRSRYNPASAASNPNRGRKRIRNNQTPAAVAPTSPQENTLPQTQSFTSNRFPSQFQDFSFQSQATTPAPAPQRSPVRSRTTLTRVQRPDISPQQNFRNFYDDPQEVQTQPSTRSRSRSRSRSRTLESSNNFNNFNREPVTEAPRRLTNTRLTNRGSFNRNQPEQQQQDNRDFNPQVLRNLNKFYGDQSLKRKELFDRKKNYCDYDDYDRTELDSSQQEDNPTHITVTHTLPLASNINNFLLPSITSVQLIAVGDLRSTNIDNSPVIYAHTSTAPGQVLYDALRAKEELSTIYTTSCYNGRQTVFSVQKTQTIYSVETISESVARQESSQDISDLLSKFLSLSPQTNNVQTPSLAISSTEITHTLTHSSTYVTQVTETDSTELAVTFRGKPIVTTIVDTSVKEITATEYSTQTSVDTRLVTQTLHHNPLANTPNTPNTQLLSALAQQNPSLENQLLLLQLSNLLPQQQQQFSTPVLPQQQFITTTSEIIHTNSYVTTLTEASSDIIPIIFRGKQIETTIVNTQTREITATEYSTEVVTRTQPALSQPLLQQPQPAQLTASLLGGLLPDLLADLSLYPDLDYADSLENLIDDSLLDPRLIAAALQDPSFDDQLFAQEEAKQEAPAEVKAAPEPQFSLTTIFKSGRNPGEFTRLVSTIYLDSRQRRDVIAPSGLKVVENTETVNNFDTFDIDIDFNDEVQSGLNF